METACGLLLIFFARIAGISIHTVRYLFSAKGRTVEASFLGFVQASIYVVVLSKTLSSLDEPITLFVYAAGFATGTHLGGLLEEKLSHGFQTVEMVCKECLPGIMADTLREAGFGVTVLDGEGRNGPTKLLFMTIDRKACPRLMALVGQKDPKAFVTLLDVRQAHGGVLRHRDGK